MIPQRQDVSTEQLEAFITGYLFHVANTMPADSDERTALISAISRTVEQMLYQTFGINLQPERFLATHMCNARSAKIISIVDQVVSVAQHMDFSKDKFK